MTKKEEAIAAIAAANPKWSEKHVAYAYELMPTSTAIYYEKGTKQHQDAHAHWLHKWTRWAIEMGLMPDDTVIPPDPGQPDSNFTRRRNRLIEGPNPTTATGKSDAPKPPSNSGVQAPREGTVGKKIWDVCDEVTIKHGREAKVEEVLEVAKSRGLNEGNTKTEFSRWRKFHSQE